VILAGTDNCELVVIGEKGAIGDDARIGLENLEDRLEAQIGHRERIGIRIDDANRNVPAGTAWIKDFLAGEARESAFAQKHRATS
jgi:hypothetical protein